MEAITQPTLHPLKTGEALQLLEASGKAGMKVPSHHSTKEAVIVVRKGTASLEFKDDQHLLHEGDSFFIPAGKVHSLSLKSNFKALVIMPVDSSIKFEN